MGNVYDQYIQAIASEKYSLKEIINKVKCSINELLSI